MTATTRKPKAARVMRDLFVERPSDDLTIVRLTVAEGAREDRYLAMHWVDSCDVRVCHSDDPTRSYVVTCSAATGKPIRCTCPARVVCRHRSAVGKLADLGVLTLPVFEDAGHDRAATE